MDLTRCQNCEKDFDQSQRLPKILICGCVQCARCVQNVLQVTDRFNCRIHNQQVSIEEQHVKDFKIQEYFVQELNKFEQQSNLIQVIQELSSQANVHKSQVISIKEAGLNFQKIFSEILRQVTQILSQKVISDCQRVVVQIEDILKKMNAISEKYQQIKNIQFQDSQQCYSSISTLNNLVKEFEGMQTEVQRVRALEYQGSSQYYRIIQEVSFQVFQELIGTSAEQRVLVQDYSVSINKYIDQQNYITNQPIPFIIQPIQQDSRIESVQQLQNILDQFQNQQFDVSCILNNPLNSINLCKKAMIIYNLIQLKSEKNYQNLLKILNLAKNQPQLQLAAANAMTILNYMNYEFTNQDFSNLDLSNADLSDTNFASCNFVNSNLSSANLRNSKFTKCDFTNTNLTSIITEYPHIFTGHTNDVRSISISGDSQYIVSGSCDQTIILWNIKTGASQTMSGHTGYVNAVAISSDSQYIASGSKDKTIILWNIKTGTSLTMSGHTGPVYSVTISVDSQYIVSGSKDKTIILWNIKTGTSSTMSGHTDTVWSVAISDDSQYIVSGSDDRTIILWNIKTGTSSAMSGHEDTVTSVAISSDSQYIVSGSGDKTIRLWDIKSLQCIKVLSGHSGSVYSVIFASSNGYIISGSYDKTIRIWNIQSGQCELTLCGHTDNVGSLSLSRDGNWLVSSNGSLYYAQSEDYNFRRWNIGRILNVTNVANVANVSSVIQQNVSQQQQLKRDWTSVYADYGLEFKNCAMKHTLMNVQDREHYIK